MGAVTCRDGFGGGLADMRLAEFALGYVIHSGWYAEALESRSTLVGWSSLHLTRICVASTFLGCKALRGRNQQAIF